MQAGGGHDVAPDQLGQRRQPRLRAGADTVGQRRDVELDPSRAKPSLWRLSGWWLAYGVQHHRQQAGVGATPRDRTEGAGG
jgi:hypothetical protein